ncbi:hypothetical protein J2790_004273 [Paenarthrobacter nicotinovorans]|nr:hypothetical protein [Paenarthrobacter nicotinovorans]SCZ65358.1 hypothetical protein SAMN02799638_04162 [Arthrobacter sp. UNCCL28]
MVSSRRAARGRPVASVEVHPNRITQQSFQSPLFGLVRAWFRGGIVYRVKIAGRPYGWGEGPEVWAAVHDGTFRPEDFGNHNQSSNY